MLFKRRNPVLANCNYEFAKQVLANQLRGSVIPNKLAALLDAFMENPCYKTAEAIVDFDPAFLSAFELARKGGFTETLYRKP